MKLLGAVGGLFCLSSALPLSNGARCELGEYTEAAPFEAHFRWQLAEPMNHLRVLGAPAQKAISSLAPEAPEVHLRTEGEPRKLIVEFEPRRAALPGGQLGAAGPGRFVAAQQAPVFRAELLSRFERRQPSGKTHTIRHILLCCEQPGPHGNIVYLQTLEVDAELGSVDIIPCGATPPRYAALLPARDYHSAAPTGLPEKFNGSPLRRDMLRLLYSMAAINSPAMAQAATPQIYAFAWQLAGRAPRPGSPWPACWGDDAENARLAARYLTPTLVYLQENDCFGCQALADFINNALFSRIFGETFTDTTHMPEAPLQETPIKYIKVKANEQEDNKH